MLLDVREPAEWRAGHAPRARHMPLGQLASRLADVPADRPVITVCRSGARSRQATAMLARALAILARLGVVRWLSRHQRVTQVMGSNMAGPAIPATMLGAPVLDVVAVGNLVGNVALSVVALSYAGQLNVTVHADADVVPDLPVLLAGIRHDWAILAATAHCFTGRRDGRSRVGSPRAGGEPRVGGCS